MLERRRDRSLAGGAVAAATAPRSAHRLGWLFVAMAVGAAAWGAGNLVAARRAAAGTAVTHIAHVHGLAAPAWAGGALLAGTHAGVVRWTETSGWRQVGASRHDLMGFRADPSADGTLYGSGHPDLRSGLPNPLGLVVSRDGGRAWAARSLAGEADLHALTTIGADGSSLLGWDALTSALRRSDDGGATWSLEAAPALAATGAVLAFDAHPTAPGRVWAATGDGLWRSDDGGVRWRRAGLEGAPVTAVASGPGGSLWAYALARPGGLSRSADGGATWTAIARGGAVR